LLSRTSADHIDIGGRVGPTNPLELRQGPDEILLAGKQERAGVGSRLVTQRGDNRRSPPAVPSTSGKSRCTHRAAVRANPDGS
jgi:hypothetical protein